jgi:glycosyltransferase involved in cell wall biosynthesis
VIDPTLLIILAGICAALMVLFGWLSRWNYLGLPELPSVSGSPGNAVSELAVVIPARNEAANISRAVAGLRPARVVVVDDHSTDRTAALAAAAGAEVIPAPPLHRFWLGKPNACWAGAQATNEKWLLFADADTWHEPGFLPALLNHAIAHGLNMVSVFPRQVCVNWHEKLLLPYAFGLYFTGVNPRAVNHPQKREALANGQCLLFRRDAYNFLGGHRAVISSVIEDVALARRAKRHRIPLAVMRAEHLASVRMYDSFGALWRGFEKNSFRFLRVNPVTGALVMLASIVMTCWLPLMILLALAGQWIMFALLLFIPALAWAGWYGGSWWALASPLAIYLFQAIAITAMTKSLFGLSTRWKGRDV